MRSTVGSLSDKTRLLRCAFILAAMLAAVTLVDLAFHATLRHWLLGAVAPIAFGGGIALLLFYAAMRYKRHTLKMPEGF